MDLSYLTQRRWIGILAGAFVFLLIALGGFPMQTSISAYYWSRAGVIFTSFLFAMGLFLITYQGYNIRETWIYTVMGAGAILVAMFPCEVGINPVTSAYLFPWIGPKANAIIHYVSAIVTFGSMGYMSAFQFTKSDTDSPSLQKIIRNRIYRICGGIIAGVFVVAVPLQLIPGAREVTDFMRLWFILEAIMVLAFSVAWLVKGEALLRDK